MKLLSYILHLCLIITIVQLGFQKIEARISNDEFTEELSYDQLVQSLSERRERISENSVSPLDDIKIHTGFGVINSFSRWAWNNQIKNKKQNGVQLGFGIDLLDSHWNSELAFRNYGNEVFEGLMMTLREWDMKVSYRNQFRDLSSDLKGKWGYRIGAGFSTRFLKISSLQEGEEKTYQTPHGLLFGGWEALLTPTFTMGFDLGIRAPLVQKTMDHFVLDTLLRTDFHF